MLSPSLPLQHRITPKPSPSSTQPLAAQAALEKIRLFLKLSPCPPNRSHSCSLHKKLPIQHGPKTSPQHLPRGSLNLPQHLPRGSLRTSAAAAATPSGGYVLRRVATSGTQNGFSIQSLSFIPQFSILAFSCVLKLSPSLSFFLLSLSSLSLILA